MPIIELHGDTDDRAWLFATMLFPSNDEQRFLAFARYKTEQVIFEASDEQPLLVDARTLRTLLASPSSSDFRSAKAAATRDGHIAGFILGAMYLMAEFDHPMPSVKKATHFLLEWKKTGATWGDGKPLPSSRSTIMEAWASHNAVSHLWAPITLNPDYPFAEQGKIFAAGWAPFLEVAAGLLEFGLTFVAAQQKKPLPILDQATVWRLPMSIGTRKLVADRVPHGLLSFLQSYKAPPSL